MNQAGWIFFDQLAAWLGMAALQASLVAALLMALARLCRQPVLRAGIVSLALLKFATPPWLSWPVSLAGANSGGTWEAAMGRATSSSAWSSLLLLSIWGAGGVAALARWGLERWKVRRILSESVTCRSEAAMTALRVAAGVLGLSSLPELRISRRAVAPFTAGVLHPVIVLPERWLVALSAADLGTVLLHEVAHVRRHDPLRLELVALLGMAWWWNPVYHWAAARSRLAIEEGCDSAVLARGDIDPQRYGKLLLHAARLIAASPVAAPLPVGVAGMSAALEHRLLHMTALHEPSRRSMVIAVVALSVLSLAAIPYVGHSMPPAGPMKHTGMHFFRHGHPLGGHSHAHPMYP